MPKNRQYYRKVKYPDKVAKPKRLVFVRIFLFRSAGSRNACFPTAPSKFYNKLKIVLVEKSSTSTNTILQRASTYISFSSVKLLYLDTLRSFNHSIC